MPVHNAPLNGIRSDWKEWITIKHRSSPSKAAHAPTALQTIATPNPYSILDDTGDFKTPWKLDSAASDHYAGKQTGIRDRRPVTNGIHVGVANGDSMHQTETGTIPFNNLPASATSVAIFKHMPHPLLSCGQLIKAGCKIILDDPQALVVDKTTGNVILKANFNHLSSTWDVPPQPKPAPATLKPAPLLLTSISAANSKFSRRNESRIAFNAYRLKTKHDLITFYGGAAGWPVKQTWMKAINNGSYAS